MSKDFYEITFKEILQKLSCEAPKICESTEQCHIIGHIDDLRGQVFRGLFFRAQCAF